MVLHVSFPARTCGAYIAPQAKALHGTIKIATPRASFWVVETEIEVPSCSMIQITSRRRRRQWDSIGHDLIFLPWPFQGGPRARSARSVQASPTPPPAPVAWGRPGWLATIHGRSSSADPLTHTPATPRRLLVKPTVKGTRSPKLGLLSSFQKIGYQHITRLNLYLYFFIYIYI
jgi:hypothetical protein